MCMNEFFENPLEELENGIVFLYENLKKSAHIFSINKLYPCEAVAAIWLYTYKNQSTK